MRFEVKSNAKQVGARLGRMAGQTNAALARALNWTAQDLRAHLQSDMRQVFDRPTPFTLNGLRVWNATSAKPVATVGFREQKTGGHYLQVQVDGGRRRLKGLEVRLRRIGLMLPDEFAMPAAGARMDAYGNMSRGQIVQILSQLGSAKFSGDFSVASNSKRSRAKRSVDAYFVSRPGREFGRRRKDGGSNDKSQHLPAGVWLRRRFAIGTAVKPVLIFTREPSYRKRWPFFETSQRITRELFPSRYRRSLAQTLKSTR